MMEDELDQMLSVRDEIVPSSGFVAAVMDAVRSEAAVSQSAPLPPIRFPWLRALPLIAALAVAIAVLGIAFVSAIQLPAAASPQSWLPPAVLHGLAEWNAGWIAASLLLAFFSTLISIRFAGRNR